jgi:DNA polymerase III delta subunit
MVAAGRLTVVAGASQRLRDEAVAGLRDGWTGPVRRLVEPGEVEGLLIGLETPSLFGDAELLLVRADQRWLAKHQDRLLPHLGQPVVAGAMLLLVDQLDGRSALAKAAAKAGVLVVADGPDDRSLPGWLALRLGAHPQGCTDLHRLTDILVRRIGNRPDALLAAIDLIALACLPGPLRQAEAEALVAGEAEQPLWELSGAVLEGRPADALRLLHAPQAAEPPQVLGALANEIRRLIACHDTKDDTEAARQAGVRPGGAFFHARRRAARWPRSALVRLLSGINQCQRQIRRGQDPLTALELLVLHAQRLVGPGRR